ncbi:MAG: hypothetical protein WDM90_24270 [Ferruginibacter sp.]
MECCIASGNKSLMTFKEKIYYHYLQVINDKVNLLQKTLADLKESGSNETKSTAGDKHETALAMLQIEQANTREQLKEAVAQKVAIEKINPLIIAVTILNGSLIKTDRGYFYMSIALGKAVIDQTNIIALSPQSPLGSKLMGAKIGDVIEMNNNRYIIQNIE